MQHSRRSLVEMRAFALGEFGAAGGIEELPIPESGEGQLRVRVQAAGVNFADFGFASGGAKDFLPTTFPLVPGIDLAGTIDAVGAGVDTFRVGDPVFGSVGKMVVGEGSFAEFVVASAGSIVRRPDAIDATVAAALPLVGSTALQIMEAAAPHEGDVVVVIGATGGVGTVVLQLLRAAGASSIAVTRAANHAYARELGASMVIDYATDDVVAAVRAAHPNGIAAVVDLAGDHALNAGLAELIPDGGHLVSLRGGADADALGARGVVGTNIITNVTSDTLARLAELVQKGVVRIPELRTFALADAGRALEEVGGSHVRGKLVIVI
jgi:NADPH:quinone reductase-like Zn-dependent oxidoreductase